MAKWRATPTKKSSWATTQTFIYTLAFTFVLTTLTLVTNASAQPTTQELQPLHTTRGEGRKLFGGYRITPKHCRGTKTLPATDPRATGPTICMFNHECAQRSGEVVGACMDGFLFGACCQIPESQNLESTLITDAQNGYYQQHQQQKLQLQQTLSNPAAAQSYESYGQSLQQHTLTHSEQEPQTVDSSYHQSSQQQNIDQVYQQLDSGGSVGGYGQQQIGSIGEDSILTSNAGNAANNQNSYSLAHTSNYPQPQQQQSDQQVSQTAPQVASIEEASDHSLQTNSAGSNTNSMAGQIPATFHVHKDSVKVSSPSSPPHNDDFVMEVLNTLTPGHEHDFTAVTTELPMKLPTSLIDHTSSESNSFEEEPSATQLPIVLSKKPVKHDGDVKQQLQEQQFSEHPSGSHHQNDVLPGAGDFTHSDITHPGADADLVEDDLQFSTGYGPKPVFVESPDNNSSVYYEPVKPPTPEDKYVLVQTITNNQLNKKPTTTNHPTTSSSITTHVDSIESIILQLNNTNHGPSYNVVSGSHQTPSYGFEALNTVNYPSSEHYYTDKASTGALASSTTKPPPASPTYIPAAYYEEIETTRPEDSNPLNELQDQQKYPIGHDQTQIPAYLEPVKTNLHLNTQNAVVYDMVSDEKEHNYLQNEYPSPKPTSGETSSHPSYGNVASPHLEDHTMPDKNYNDATGTAHLTSEFNKMPAVGIAYPVDMSYMEEEGSIALDGEEQSIYGGQIASTPSQKPFDSSVTSTQQKVSALTEPQPPKPHLPSLIESHTPPVMITSQNYNQQPHIQYNQVPDEVSVSSQTTKVQEDYESTSTSQHIISSSTPDATSPHYSSSTTGSSTPRPIIITASHQHTKLTTKHPSKQPSSSSSKRPSKPQGNRKPAQPTNTHNYASTAQHASVDRLTVTQPANSYQQTPNTYSQEDNLKKPVTQSYHSEPVEQSTTKLTEKQPIQAYSHDPQQPTQPPPLVDKQGQSVSSSPVQRPATRKPVSKRPAGKPISTSYVTGPSTPRPPTTFGYHIDEVPPLIIADDKLDSFVHSTAGAFSVDTPISGIYQSTYQAPIYASSVTPMYVQRPQTNYNTHKKPGFVKIQSTTKPQEPAVLITPKPTVINLVTLNSWTQNPNVGGLTVSSAHPPTTPSPAFSSTSYVYSPIVTRRPDLAQNTPEYVSLSSVTSNDFDDPGYHGFQNVHPAFTQATTEATYGIPSDDRPAFPGYYGPTPTYPAFQIPGVKVSSQIEEETHTSPNDFVNFPPVRNPNLNMSAASSAVTSDLELSTPAFVEDVVLKDKMNTLVNKIVESLQGNFEALANMIDDVNSTAPFATYQADAVHSTAGSTTVTRKPTRKTNRTTTAKPKATTKKSVTRTTTKAPPKRTTATTRKPANRRTTTTTRKPGTRKPTKKTSTTTTTPSIKDDIVDEEDEEDINPSENEINPEETGTSGRKIQCGVRPHVKSGRIVGGKGATFGEFPWQVLVRESTWLGLFTKNKCGGVLITSRYVITAAHCQPGFLASLVAVMGEFDISGDLESKRSVTKNVKRVIVHRQYDPGTFENDLALLELESTVQFDTHIVPICMPSDFADFTGRMATVTGWGRLKYGGGVPSVLQEVQVPVIENSVCQEMFHTAGHNKKILNSFLCAGYANGQKDSCEGDSGGPLVLQRPDGRYELAGTVSHGIKCAAPYLPGVYMRTTFYKPWLRSITGVK